MKTTRLFWVVLACSALAGSGDTVPQAAQAAQGDLAGQWERVTPTATSEEQPVDCRDYEYVARLHGCRWQVET